MIKNIVSYSLLIVICFLPIFLHLDKQSIRLWDESLFAVNAFEMSQNGNFIVKYLGGKPDLMNTKPPFITWIQAIFMKIFGYSELSVRLPSALCALLTIMLIFRFCTKELGNPFLGYITSLVLVTSVGYITDHVARTGDADAALVLFLTASVLYFYKYLNYGKNIHLTIFTISVVLAVLTKGIFGLFYIPGILVYTIQQKKIKTILKTPRVYISAAIFLVIVIGYYLLREYNAPGYLHAVWKNEIGGRYLSAIEGETGKQRPFFFYFRALVTWQFSPWVFFLPFGYIIVFAKKYKYVRNLYILLSSCIITLLLIISIARNKLDWYAAPLLPLLSIIVGTGLYELFSAIRTSLDLRNKILRYGILISIGFALFIAPYRIIILMACQTKDRPGEKYGYYMKELKESNPACKTYSIMHQGRNHHILFYKEIFNEIHGYKISRKFSPTELLTGDKVLSCQDETLEWIREHFDVEVIDNSAECKLIQIGNPKNAM